MRRKFQFISIIFILGLFTTFLVLPYVNFSTDVKGVVARKYSDDTYRNSYNIVVSDEKTREEVELFITEYEFDTYEIGDLILAKYNKVLKKTYYIEILNKK